ncbi:EAL domain-containing protein [uncultured Pseudacidovorax sp.]|uniref:putative bifunctional diguanylate cyclase/phosphodiesterase n=1 Tax=uncultured Pseudacidovorax sp. TaxID=679313 RepID=UPI0025D51CD4|nr:EAL domain-containing protein [uncultured Pseudacidovorax sp.]
MTSPFVLGRPKAARADLRAHGEPSPDVHAAVRLALAETDVRVFAQGALDQLALLLDAPCHGLVCAAPDGRARGPQVLVARGRYVAWRDLPLAQLPEAPVRALLTDALVRGASTRDAAGRTVLFIGRADTGGMAVLLDVPRGPGARPDWRLLDAVCDNLGLLLHSRGLLERLHDRAYQDPLVPLPNRARFIEKVDECVRRGLHGHILALVDIDDFSATNDVMGHRFGDRLLEVVAARLADTLPPGVLLARVGADTFGVLGSAGQVAPQRLLDCVGQPLTVEAVPHKVTLTCGWVRLGEGGGSGVDLVKDATIALKRAKRDHRGQHLQYLDHMGAEARARAMLLSDLRAAIEHRQLFLVYQPQLDLDTGALIGLEALLRWRCEDGRFIPPAQFIPVAEHSGLIVALGEWVLVTACRTMRELLDAGGAPQRMAVNVSMAQLQDPGFATAVRNALAESGISGRHLELEITESVAVLPTDFLEATLQGLRADGISIAIDDFGTGYSSLSYLERLPLDRIKIDRTFVRQLGEPRGARIAEMVVQLGRRLGLAVLAEGIEDAAACRALQAMGCHEGQGYHLAMPMEKAALENWLRARA